MKLNKLILHLVVFFVLNSCTYAKVEYLYQDIGECIIPIKNSLKLIDSNKLSFIYVDREHSFDKTLDSPISMTIEKKLSQKSIDKIIKLGHLSRILEKGTHKVYSDNKQKNNIFLVILKEYVIMTVNYTKKEVEFILNSCVNRGI